MARHVADVRAGLLAVAGAHVRDPLALPVELAEPSPGRRAARRRRRRPARRRHRPRHRRRDPRDRRRARRRRPRRRGGRPGELRPPRRAVGWLLMADLRALRRCSTGDGRRRTDVPRASARAASPAFDTAGVVDAAPRAQRRRPGVARLPHRLGRPAQPDVGAAGVRPRRRHRARRTAAGRARGAPPGLPANLLGLPAAVVPCGIAERVAGRRPVHGRVASPTSPRSPRRRRSRTPSGH